MHKLAEHLENYIESVFLGFFVFVFSCAVRAHPGGFIIFIPPHRQSHTPLQDPHLLVNHHPGAIGWSGTRGREQAKAREDETGGREGPMCEWVKGKKQTNPRMR